jgi:hypothetical protein
MVMKPFSYFHTYENIYIQEYKNTRKKASGLGQIVRVGAIAHARKLIEPGEHSGAAAIALNVYRAAIYQALS